MKLFKKNVRSNHTDKAAAGIANCILQFQQRFAKKLGGVTVNWRARHQWIFLYLICVVFCGLSVISIIQSFRLKGNAKVIMLRPITVPGAISKESKLFLITEKEFQEVLQFKITHPGLQKDRPQLFDSLNQVEQSYYSQQK